MLPGLSNVWLTVCPVSVCGLSEKDHVYLPVPLASTQVVHPEPESRTVVFWQIASCGLKLKDGCCIG